MANKRLTIMSCEEVRSQAISNDYDQHNNRDDREQQNNKKEQHETPL